MNYFSNITAFMLCYTQDDASAEGGMYCKISILTQRYTFSMWY